MQVILRIYTYFNHPEIGEAVWCGNLKKWGRREEEIKNIVNRGFSFSVLEYCHFARAYPIMHIFKITGAS